MRISRPDRFRYPSTISNISSKATELIDAMFHMEPLLGQGTKSYSDGLGHMNKMAAMPISGKPFKIFSRP